MITAVIFLALLGLALYLIETFIPMSPPFPLIIRVIVVLFAFIYLVRLFNIVDIPLR
jgi:hypothetical protein